MALATAHVNIVADTSGFERDLKQKLKKTGAASGKAFQQSFRQSMRKIQLPKIDTKAAGQGKTAGKQFASNFSKTASTATAAGSTLTKGISKGMGSTGKKAGKSFGASFARGASAPIAALGKTTLKLISSFMDVGMGADAKTFGVMATAVGGLVAAVAPLAGYLAGLPALLAGVGTSAATAAVAFQGMGEAISAGLSGDMDTFNEQLRKLQPSAAGVAKEIVGLKPAFSQLKGATQESFFGELTGQIEKLGSVVKGPILNGMSKLATALGQAGKGVTDFLTSAEGGTAMQSVFRGIAKSVQQISPMIQPFMRGLTDMAADAAGSLGGIGTVMGKIGVKMSEMAESGSFSGWIESASHAAKQLGQAVSALMPTWSALMDLFGTVGENVRQTLIPAFAAVGAGIQAMMPAWQGIFNILGSLVGGVMPVVGAAFTTLGKVLAALVMPLLRELSPVLAQLTGQMGGDLVAAIKWLSPMLIQLATVVGQGLAAAFRLLIPIIRGVIGDLYQSFSTVAPYVQGVMNMLIGIFQTVGGILQGNWSMTWDGMKKILWGAWAVIKQGFIDLKNWIIGVGRAIIDGFIGGAKAAWEGGKSFFGGIGSWIKQHKGPLSYDRRLLIPAGEAIMNGFREGLERGWGDVANMIHGVAGDMTSMFPDSLDTPTINPRAGRSPFAGAPFDLRPVPLETARGATSTGVLTPTEEREGRTTSNTHTTTIGPPTINVHGNSADPVRVARRTANRLASLTTA